MPIAMNQTVWLPRRFSFVHFDLESYTATVVCEPTTKRITLENNLSQQIKHNCSTGHCPIYMDGRDAIDQYRRTHIVDSSEYKSVKDMTQEAATALGKCSGYLIADSTCPQGKTFGVAETIEVNVPSLMYTHRLRTRDKFFIYQYEERDSKLFMQPFGFPNIYDTGSICWGQHNGTPKTLAAAVNLYWSAPFNGDLFTCGNLSWKDALHSYVASSFRWHDATDMFFGNLDKKIIRERPCDALLISKDPKVLSAIPQAYHWETPEGTTALAWVKRGANEKEWFLSFKHKTSKEPYTDLLALKKSLKLSSSGKLIVIGTIGSIV